VAADRFGMYTVCDVVWMF